MVFVDADFFIGLYFSSDPHHKTCISLIDKIKDDLITSHDVIDEVVTKLSYFKRKDLALQFIKDVKKTAIIIVFPDMSLFEKASNIFASQKQTHVSLTDCMNMAIAKEQKIINFLSFDEVYEKNGFKLLS